MTNNPSSPKQNLSVDQLEEQLQDQLAFLERSCAAFDEGYSDEFKRLAVTLRVLLHDTPKSHSLLGQLNMKQGHFVSYSEPIDGRNLLPDWPLAIAQIGPDGPALLPALDGFGEAPRLLPFEDWWNEPVYRDPTAGICLTRKFIVLAVSNKDGGAHVDPKIDEQYAHFVKSGTGLVASTPQGELQLDDLEKVSVRHIAFEAIASIQTAFTKRLGNKGCSCGSGRKHRYCCGKRKALRPGVQ